MPLAHKSVGFLSLVRPLSHLPALPNSKLLPQAIPGAPRLSPPPRSGGKIGGGSRVPWPSKPLRSPGRVWELRKTEITCSTSSPRGRGRGYSQVHTELVPDPEPLHHCCFLRLPLLQRLAPLSPPPARGQCNLSPPPTSPTRPGSQPGHCASE